MYILPALIPLLINGAIIVLIIAFIYRAYKKTSSSSERKNAELQQISERLEKIEKDIEELKKKI